MKLSRMILESLDRVEPLNPMEAAPIVAEEEGITAGITLDDWDRLAVSLVSLHVTAAGPGVVEDEDAFVCCCRRIAEGVNYLEEPLMVVEVDRANRVGIIRSRQPLVDENSVAYLEILVNGRTGEISLSRVVRRDDMDKPILDHMVMGRRTLVRVIDFLVGSWAVTEQ
ncbi:MAG: hypothetical protein HQK57_05140 [Deltaproteobacteria bacterium]|nr:hypothetical protein [Deltaproteobacteria bacterium]